MQTQGPGRRHKPQTVEGQARVTPPVTRTLPVGHQFAMLRPLQPGLFSGTAASCVPTDRLVGGHSLVGGRLLRLKCNMSCSDVKTQDPSRLLANLGFD